MKAKRRVMLLMIMVLTIGSCITVYAANSRDANSASGGGYTVYGTLNVSWNWFTADYGIATADSNELETHYVNLVAYNNNRIVSSGSKTTYVEKAVYAINANCDEYRSRSTVKVGNVPKATVILDIKY